MSYKHRSDNDGRFSQAIWADLPDELFTDPNAGIYRLEDFHNFGQSYPVANNIGFYVGRAGPYKSFEDTSAAIAQDPTRRGTLKMTLPATDNKEAWLQSNSGVGNLGAITSGSSGRKTWFEASGVEFSQIVTQNFRVGLAEEGLAVENVVADDGTQPDKDFVGFSIDEDASATLNFTYSKAGQTAQIPIATLQTIVADTAYNLGFVFDPTDPNVSRRLRVFLNGAEQTTYVTATQIAAATFPSGEELAFLIGGKTSGAAAKTFYCTGWRFAQVF